MAGHRRDLVLAFNRAVAAFQAGHFVEAEPGLRERTISEMAQIFKGAIIFGEDGMSVPIKGGGPHRLS